MNWAGASVALGLVALAATAPVVGVPLLVLMAWAASGRWGKK